METGTQERIVCFSTQPSFCAWSVCWEHLVGLETWCSECLCFQFLSSQFSMRVLAGAQKSCTVDALTALSPYSPDCPCSSAGDISNFPQQPFMNSCRLSHGSRLAQRVVKTEEIRIDLVSFCFFSFFSYHYPIPSLLSSLLTVFSTLYKPCTITSNFC